MKKYYFAFLMVFALFSASGQINSGNPAKPFNTNSSYPNGIMPTNLPSGGTYGKSQAAADAYNSWKNNFVENCSNNGFRVRFDDGSFTVSEGIAYGMLLSAYAGDKALFDGLWKYYKVHSANGVMHWKIQGCNNVNQQGGATDAELDAAMALMVAEDQWPTAMSPYDYRQEAITLIGTVRAIEMHQSSHQVLNGNNWGQGNNCRNPSYFAPAYFREYAKLEGATFWGNAVTAANSFLLSNRNATTGLVSDWADQNASPNTCQSNSSLHFGFEACRNPWRMANDVLWNGAGTATTASDICNKLTNWLKGHESNLRGPISLNAANPSNGQYKNGTFTTFGLAPMGTSSANQSVLNNCYNGVVSVGNENVYFNATLRTITLFMMTGNFWKPGSNIVSASAEITAPANNSSYELAENVTISATATISAGTISKVEFYDGSTLLNSDNASPYTFSTTTLAAGTHVITARVYDGNNTIVAVSAPVNITVVGLSDISTTGATDMFETTTELTKLTGGKDCAAPTKSAGAGVYWWEDVSAATPFKAVKTRAGDGKLTYTISQAQGAYEAIGFSFGDHCNGGTKVPYTLDLRTNSVLKMNVSAPATNTSNLEVKVQLKDADGTLLVFSNLVVNNGAIRDDWATGAYYRYEIGFNKNHTTQAGQTPAHADALVGPGSLKPGDNVNFEFDFSKAVTVSGTNYPTNINTNNTAFDYSKVVSVVIIVVSSTDSGAPSYQPLAFTDQKINFSGMTLGAPFAGAPICNALAPTVAAGPTYCQGATATALTATPLTGMNLKWYGTSETGGTGVTTATVPNTASSGTATYYVAQALDACEGPRSPIVVTITPSVTPTCSLTVNPGNVVNAGTTVNFTATATNGGQGATYKWYKNNVVIPAATAATYTTSDLALNDVIKAEVTSNATCASPATVASNEIEMTIITGVNDAVFSGMEIYPNPVADQLQIKGLSAGFDYQVMDVTGKVILEGNSSDGMVDVAKMNSGMFVLMIKSEGKQKLVKLLKK